MNCDVLIIGSGAAGLTLAIKLAIKRPEWSILLTTKTYFEDSNSSLAQGGVAAVMNSTGDSIQQHIQDTLEVGGGLCNEAAVSNIISQGPKRIKELIKWGWKADQVRRGKLDLAKEGGHSNHRVVHHGDASGLSIVQVLLRKARLLPNISLREHMLSLDVILNEKVCIGAQFINTQTKSFEDCFTNAIVLATGGAGQVYATTTNPIVATGDGLAIAHRAGAVISNMEFIQFHPSAFFEPEKSGSAFLISEAVRGAGAKLCHQNGEAFMHLYDMRGSLAPRDVVARSISKELAKRKVNHVYLDCREIPKKIFAKHFPNILKHCLERQINPSSDFIPVAPAAHYICGGIETDLTGATSIPQLFAIGECADTGLHGANRLASNSLLEALAMAHNAANFISAQPLKTTFKTYQREDKLEKKEIDLDYEKVISSLQRIMSANAGIVRRQSRIIKALKKIDKKINKLNKVNPKPKFIAQHAKTSNLLLVASLILSHSLKRSINVGGFYKIEESHLPETI